MTSPEPRHRPHTSAVIVAAGDGTRMQLPEGQRKPLLEIEGHPVLVHTCAAFAAAASVDELVIVAHRDDVERIQRLARDLPQLAKVVATVSGGATRAASVRAGVTRTSEQSELVAIHDAARPLILPDTIDQAVGCAAREGACLVAVPVSDTIKESPDGERASLTRDRSQLWAAQTPQVFGRAMILELLEQAQSEGIDPTDDAALHERFLGPIQIVRGDSTNIKLTTPTDAAIAAAILRSRASTGTRS